MGAVADHRHRGAGEVRPGLDDAAVMQIAVEHRLLALVELLAHGGVDAVGADQNIALGLADRLARRIGEARDHGVAALLELRQAMAGDDSARTQPLADRGEQYLVQLAARDRNLRPAITGGAAARLGPDQLTVLVVEGELLGEDTGRREFFRQAQRRQLADGVGLQIDAVTERAQGRHRLVDAAGHTDLVQAQRLGQSGDAAADNDDLHSSIRW